MGLKLALGPGLVWYHSFPYSLNKYITFRVGVRVGLRLVKG